MAKRDVETATIAVAAFNGDVKEEDFVLFRSSPLFVFKSACVSDDDRGDMMMMSDDTKHARAYKFLPRLRPSVERKKSRASVYFRVSQYTLNGKNVQTRTKEENSIWRLY